MAFGMQPVCDPAWADAAVLPPVAQAIALASLPSPSQSTVAADPAGLVPPTPSGEALVEPLHLLDELAWSLGVTALSTYTDDRLLPDDADPDPAKALAALGPREDWHAVGDGIHTCAALLRELQRNPQAEVSAAAVQALQDLHDWLQRVAPSRQRFRLDAPKAPI